MKGKKIFMVCLFLLILICTLEIINNKLFLTQIEIESSHDIYYGDIIDLDDFKLYLIFNNGQKKEIKIQSIDKIYAEPNLIVDTKLGTFNVNIDIIKIKSITSNLPKDYIEAGKEFVIPNNFKLTLVYENGVVKTLYKKDVIILQENLALQHGENKVLIKWHNICKEEKIYALAYPIVQSEIYPMFYKDLTTTIEITKERHHDADCFVAHIITSDPLALKTTYPEGGWGSHAPMSQVMEYRNAIFMINADYSDWSTMKYTPIVRNGQVINEALQERDKTRILGINNEGHLYEVKHSYMHVEVRENGLRDTWTFWYGFTIKDGERIIKNSTVRHPRTFIGEVLRDDGKLEYYLVVADGRRSDSLGFTHDFEGELLFNKGCWIAYNLDGGGSSEMMFDGKILNIPSDGQERWDHDFIYFELWGGI